jgi:hypothetical protein
MSLDPKQIFVMNALTRESIAEDCNNYLESIGSKQRVAIGDYRLVADLCQRYTDCLSQCFDNANDEEENAQNAVEWLLDEMGVTTAEPAKERDPETRRLISEIKMEIVRLQFKLADLEGE